MTAPVGEIPVDFTIARVHLGCSTGDLTAHDARGCPVFRVVGRRRDKSSRRRSQTVFDAAGAPLITLVHHDGEWEAYRGNSLEWNDLIFTAQKTFHPPWKAEVDVFSGTNAGDLKPSFRIKGSPFWRSCAIIRGNSIVAQTSLLYKLKKVIYSRNKFRLTVYPGNDPVLVMAMLVVFYGGR